MMKHADKDYQEEMVCRNEKLFWLYRFLHPQNFRSKTIIFYENYDKTQTPEKIKNNMFSFFFRFPSPNNYKLPEISPQSWDMA